MNLKIKTVSISVFLLSIACSETAIEGPQGAPGEPGARGPAGAPGETIAASYARESSSLVEGFGGASVLCDEGDVLLGGGCRWGKSVGNEARPFASQPLVAYDDKPCGWSCAGTAELATEVTAFAVCGVAP